MTTGLLITNVGQAAIAADLAGGANLVLTHVAVGDSFGNPYNPNVHQVALVNERYRMTIASVAVMANEIIVDAVMPADTADASGRSSHSFNVAEIGLFSADNTMIGVARMSNGYKPPPSSGQAAIATFRLKLAVANPSAITVVVDPQAQVILGRHVRAFWMTVDGHRNDPPADPGLGATYAVGDAPTGAWAGFNGRLAQWVGVWSLSSPPAGHMVCDNSKADDHSERFLRRYGLGWTSALVTPAAAGLASEAILRSQRGNYVAAGQVAGTANDVTLACTPVFASAAALVGVPLVWVSEARNTGPMTVNVDGLGPVSVVHPGGFAVAPGDTDVGHVMRVRHNGTQFVFEGRIVDERLASAYAFSVYGGGARFANLGEAMSWLSRRRITAGGSVTLNLAAGQQVDTTSVDISHPDINRLYIRGGAMTGAVPQIGAGLQVTGHSPAAQAADAIANLTTMRARWPTELRFTGGAGLQVVGSLGLIDRILLTSDASIAPGLGNLLTFNGGTPTMGDLGVHGAGKDGVLVRSAVLALSGPCAAAACSGNGINVLDSGAIDAGVRFDSVGCAVHGISTLGGTISVRTNPWHAAGNGFNGFNVGPGGTIVLPDGASANTNAVSGFFASAGTILAPGSVAGDNGYDGVQVGGGGAVIASSLSMSATNGRSAAYATQGRIDLTGATLTNQTVTPKVRAFDGSFIETTAGVNVGATTPALNTVGNANSYVKG